MKYHSIRAFFVSLLIFLSATKMLTIQGDAVALAQAKKLTVLEYYLKLPAKYITGSQDDNEQMSEAERFKLLKYHYPEHGYIRLGGDNWDGYAEVVLFRKPDGTAIIAANHVGFGPAPDQNLKFLEFKNSRWIDRTDDVMPFMTENQVNLPYFKFKGKNPKQYPDHFDSIYLLPRLGTTIQIATFMETGAPDFVLCELRWVNGKFIARQPESKIIVKVPTTYKLEN